MPLTRSWAFSRKRKIGRSTPRLATTRYTTDSPFVKFNCYTSVQLCEFSWVNSLLFLSVFSHLSSPSKRFTNIQPTSPNLFWWSLKGWVSYFAIHSHPLPAWRHQRRHFTLRVGREAIYIFVSSHERTRLANRKDVGFASRVDFGGEVIKCERASYSSHARSLIERARSHNRPSKTNTQSKFRHEMTS